MLTGHWLKKIQMTFCNISENNRHRLKIFAEGHQILEFDAKRHLLYFLRV